MRYGVCTSIDHASVLHRLGFDYVEVHAGSLAAMTEEEFSGFLAENAAAPIHAEAANCLFPGEIRLTGDCTDRDALEHYIEKTFSRLERAGISLVVFGSGGSRSVPEGFPREKAWDQLIHTGRILAAAGERHGVTVALEPLRPAESNIINTQAEGRKLAEAVNHPNFRLVCDYFHLMEGGEAPRDAAVGGEFLTHVHMAAPVTRRAMSPEDGADYGAFFRALASAGYDGRVSFEGSSSDYAKDLPAALAVMRQE